MNELADWTLASLVSYGIPLLLLVSYVGSLGIPFPITLVIMAAGAITRAGLLDWRLALLACLAGAALADHSEYLLGRWAGQWARRRYGQRPAWQKALALVTRQNGLAILLTRFWLTPLAPAVNFIAGSRYPYLRFLFFDLAGELLWVILYGGLGYLFAGQVQLASQLVSSFCGVSVALLALVGLVYLLVVKVYRK